MISQLRDIADLPVSKSIRQLNALFPGPGLKPSEKPMHMAHDTFPTEHKMPELEMSRSCILDHNQVDLSGLWLSLSPSAIASMSTSDANRSNASVSLKKLL